jgi:hypothetical protein
MVLSDLLRFLQGAGVRQAHCAFSNEKHRPFPCAPDFIAADIGTPLVRADLCKAKFRIAHKARLYQFQVKEIVYPALAREVLGDENPTNPSAEGT